MTEKCTYPYCDCDRWCDKPKDEEQKKLQAKE